MTAINLRELWRRLVDPIDPVLFGLLAVLLVYALMVLASATNDFIGRFYSQLVNLGVALAVMRVAAQIPPQRLMHLALPVYIGGLLLLVAVALFGDVSKGARRWLNLGFARIQPSEIMKIAMPLMLAWYFQKREALLRWKDYVIAVAILAVPVLLIAKQPDLGTAILVLASGFFVIFLAGLSWKLILPVAV
ncbi:MAG: FtsW/RodA/SpoVE family cell cycle protein, partial [Pseudomonadota bacterium]